MGPKQPSPEMRVFLELRAETQLTEATLTALTLNMPADEFLRRARDVYDRTVADWQTRLQTENALQRLQDEGREAMEPTKAD